MATSQALMGASQQIQEELLPRVLQSTQGASLVVQADWSLDFDPSCYPLT